MVCCSVLFDTQSSFRVASDFQGFLQRFDCVGSMFKLGQMLKAVRSSGVAPSFKEARISSRAQRASKQLGVSILDWRFRFLPHYALPMKGFL